MDNPLTPLVAAVASTSTYSIESERFEPEHFGDAVITLVKDSVRIRVVRDRGQDFVEVAGSGSPGDWFEASLVLETIEGSELQSSGEPRDATDLLQEVVDAGAQLEQVFSSERLEATNRALRERATIRARRRFGGG